jgi:ribosome-associated heat shock protein Hsp15
MESPSSRLDRWLWAARFFRTRAQAKQAIEGGKVQIGGDRAKPSRNVRVGDAITITRGEDRVDVQVLALSERRGGAPEAQLLYAETQASHERRATTKEQNRLTRGAFSAPPGRPSKRDRRALTRLKSQRAAQDGDAD